MSSVPRSLRGPLAVIAVLALAIVVAIPVMAASPSPSASQPSASQGTGKGEGNGQGNGKGPKGSHEPEIQVTLKGTISTTTSADGSVEYAITSGGKVLALEAGPPWFWGDKHPLKAYVGKTVTVVGEQSGTEVDVLSVDGAAIRAPGKPPWAGGWKVVGSAHPGWSQEKADRQKAKDAAKAEKRAAKAACKAAGTCVDDDADESEAPGS